MDKVSQSEKLTSDNSPPIDVLRSYLRKAGLDGLSSAQVDLDDMHEYFDRHSSEGSL